MLYVWHKKNFLKFPDGEYHKEGDYFTTSDGETYHSFICADKEGHLDSFVTMKTVIDELAYRFRLEAERMKEQELAIQFCTISLSSKVYQPQE